MVLLTLVPSAAFGANGTITGTINFGSSGLTSVSVNATPQGGGSGAGTTVTPGSAAFSLSVAPGTYSVSFAGSPDSINRLVEPSSDVVVTSGQPTALGTLSTVAGGAITARVATVGGGIARNALCANARNSSWQPLPQATVGSDGSFTIVRALTDEYTVTIDGCSSSTNVVPYEISSVETTLGSTTTLPDIDIAAGGSIDGSIGAVPGGVTRGQICARAESSNGSGASPVTADAATGTFEIVGLGSGSYTLVIERCSGEDINVLPVRQAVVVTAGETASVGVVDLVAGGQIAGTVDFSGIGLTGVSVQANRTQYLPGANAYANVSVDDGAFTLKGLPAGTYRLSFDANGNDPATSNAIADDVLVTVITGSTETVPPIVMQPGGSITGTVDGASLPVGVAATDVCVSAARVGNSFGSSWGGANSPDAGTGAFGVYRLRSGRYTVTLARCSSSDVNLLPTTRDVIVSAGSATAISGAIALSEGGVVTGTIGTVAGGIAKNRVCVSAFTSGNMGGGEETRPNASSGAFSIKGLRPGTYTVRIKGCYSSSPLNLLPTTRTAVVGIAPGATVALGTINVAAGGVAEITPSVPAGVALSNLQVNAQPVPWDSGESAYSSTAQNGTFRLVALRAGSYRLSIQSSYGSASNVVGSSTLVTIDPDGAATTWSPTLAEGRRISGTVSVPAGVDPTGVCANANRNPWTENGGYGRATVNADGTYEITGLAAGSYQVRFADCGDGATNVVGSSATADLSTATLASGVDATMVAGGTVEGTITLAAGLDPETVCVYAQPLQWASDSTYGNTTVRSDRSYRITALKTGAYRISFNPCWRGELIGGSVSPVTVTQGATVTMDPRPVQVGGAISGTIQVPGASVTTADQICVNAYRVPWSNDNANGYAQADASGAFRIQGLAAGSYKVSISSCSGSSDLLRKSVTVPGVTLGATTAAGTITLQVGATVTGRVTKPDGPDAGTDPDPVSGVCVSGQRVPWTSDESGYGYTQTDANGDYAMRGLGTGSYTVTVQTAAGCGELNLVGAPARRITATVGQTTTRNLGLVEGGRIAGNVTSGGSGVGNVCVNVNPSANSAATTSAYTETSTSGAYEITGLATGTYDLNYRPCWNSAANLVEATFMSVTVTAGSVLTRPTVALQAGASIAGSILDSDGNGVAGACVNAFRPWIQGTNDFGAGYSSWAQSDENGLYRLVGLKGATYTVQVDTSCSDSDLAPGSSAGIVVGNAQERTGVNVVLAAGGSITGVVTDAAGAPIGEVCVSAEKTPFDPAAPVSGWAQSANDGTYTVSRLVTGTYAVSFRPCDDTVNLVGDVANGISVTAGRRTEQGTTVMGAGGIINGRVVKSDGPDVGTDPDPADGICVSAARDSYNALGGSSAWTQTAADGTYQLRGLNTGSFTVDFYLCGFDDAGNGDTGNGVTIDPKRVTGVTAGGSAQNAGDALIVPAAAIAGRVTKPDGPDAGSSPDPIEGVCVSAATASGATDAGAWGAAITDASGDYVVAGLGTGGGASRAFLVSFEECGGARTVAREWYDDASSVDTATPVTVTAGTRTSAINALLEPAGTVSGAVTTASGGGADSVCVAAFLPTQSTTQATTPVAFTTTAYDGTFSLENVKYGTYRIYFAPCGVNVMELRGEWYNDAATAAAATTVTVGDSSSPTGINAQLAAWGTTTPTCNPMLFDSGDCRNPVLYRSPTISPDSNNEVTITPPALPVEVQVDPDMIQQSGNVTVDGEDPDAADAPAAPSTTGGAADPLAPYIEVKVFQGGRMDPGGSWTPPLEVTFDVPVEAAGTPDDQLVAYFMPRDGEPWTRIPYIGSRSSSPTLNDNEPDGYFVTGTGENRQLHVLTRHATTFGMFGPAQRSGGGGGGTGGSGESGTSPGGASSAATPTRTRQSAVGPKSVRAASSAKLPAVSAQGVALSWKTTTGKTCRVIKRIDKVTKKATWTVRGLKAGSCVVIGANAGNASLLPAAIKLTIKVR